MAARWSPPHSSSGDAWKYVLHPPPCERDTFTPGLLPSFRGQRPVIRDAFIHPPRPCETHTVCLSWHRGGASVHTRPSLRGTSNVHSVMYLTARVLLPGVSHHRTVRPILRCWRSMEAVARRRSGLAPSGAAPRGGLASKRQGAVGGSPTSPRRSCEVSVCVPGENGRNTHGGVQ